ncbi:MAG: CoA transferase [Syntrophus sp. (in: bacteria)]|nr:CoA transferase [Syntrophus sp. (in: bacteria)]
MLPLEGYKILDLTQRLPGPLCTLILADMGMDVIKIEEPKRGDFTRSMPPFYNNQGALFVFLNRNKRSIALDLKSMAGREIFLKMAATADVVLEGSKPGFMQTLKVDYEEVKKVNPGVVYCSLSGYGQDGPYRDRAGHDLNYNAIAGILAMTGNEAGPALPGLLLADVAGGLAAVIAIMMGLLHKEKTGHGQYVDVSMFDVLFSWFSLTNVAQSIALDKPLLREEGAFTGKLACYQMYRTKDDQYVTLGSLEQKFWNQFCASIDREDLRDGYLEDERQPYLKEELRQMFASKEKDEWMNLFADKDFCFEPVKSVKESLSDIQVLARKLIFEACDSSKGSMKQINLPFKSSVLNDPPYYSKPPLLGEHTESIMLELGFSPKEIEQYSDKGVV